MQNEEPVSEDTGKFGEVEEERRGDSCLMATVFSAVGGEVVC